MADQQFRTRRRIKMKKLLAMLLVLTMVLSLTLTAGAEGKTLKDYPRAEGFNAMVTSGGITDEEFNAQALAQKIRNAAGYNVQFTQLPRPMLTPP